LDADALLKGDGGTGRDDSLAARQAQARSAPAPTGEG
jgi:hypothetical protein